MPTPDYNAIADALAARFAGGVATPVKPAGETDIRTATADVPSSMGPVPAVFVFGPESGTFPVQGGQTRVGVTRFRVRFYLGLSIDDARIDDLLRRWLTVLVQRLKVATTLGGTVDLARIAEWRLGIVPFGPDQYDGIELLVDVTNAEAWAAT